MHPAEAVRALLPSVSVTRVLLGPALAWGLGAVLGTTASLLSPDVVAAEEPSPPAEPSLPAEPSRRAVVVVAVPEGDAVLRLDALRPTVRSHFAGTDLDADVRSLPAGDILDHIAWAESVAEGRAHAVLWVEPSRDGTPRLYLVQPSTGRAWVRRLPVASEPEVAAESLGVMARALASGLDDGEPVGMEEMVLERPAAKVTTDAEPTTPEPPPPRVEGFVALGYHGSSVSDDRRWHSGAEVRLGLRLPAGVLLSLGGAWAPRGPGQGEPAMAVQRVAVDLRGGWSFRPHPRMWPQVDASVVVEALGWSVESSPEFVGRRGTAWRVGVAPGAGVVVPLVGGLGLRVHAQADVWLRNADLVLDDGGVSRSLVRMHPAAGRVDVGFAYWW